MSFFLERKLSHRVEESTEIIEKVIKQSGICHVDKICRVQATYGVAINSAFSAISNSWFDSLMDMCLAGLYESDVTQY